MFGRKKKNLKSTEITRCSLIEGLESRRLLSAYGSLILQPHAVLQHQASTTTDISGYTPADIRQAYGFNNITFANGSIVGDGKGQTIAIVDAYNDPNISADLKTFDSQFGISAPPSFQVVNQSGGTKLPTTDGGWAGEISLDVEWAHADAPGANILLVEANSATLNDLMAAVNYARHASGVSTISMSWGGSEFFSWSNGEFTGQTQYDPYFTTPSGHQGITFVAAAGDSGSFGGVQWPASSPNVLSVGGTSLYVNSDGSYSTETSWSGTSGGYSQIEAKPSYQDNVQTSAVRSTPDVSLNGDPNTGFAVYDSLAFQGFSGWQQVGGTSAGAPQWAALIAIADQGRLLNGQGTLDGVSQTLPMLYSLYTVADYTNNFNDVIDVTSHNPYHWRWGFGFGNQATSGYDTATGLGTPKGAAIVSALAGSSTTSASTSGSGTTGGSTGGTNSQATPQLPASPLSAVILSAPPDSITGGALGSVRLRITNTTPSRFDGPVTVKVYLSTDGSATSGDTLLTSLTIPALNLKGRGSKIIHLTFKYPASVSTGDYFLTAAVSATRTNTADATTATPKAIAIGQPHVDLAAGFSNGPVIMVTPGAANTALITVENVGNVTANGTVGISLYDSVNNTLDSSAVLLATMPSRKIVLRAGRSMTFRIHFVAPTDQTASNFLIASLASHAQPSDNNAANDTAVVPTL